MPGLQLNIPETEKMLQFGTKNSRRAWHVIPAQEVKPWNVCCINLEFFSFDRCVFTLYSKCKNKDIFVLEICKNLDASKITETFFSWLDLSIILKLKSSFYINLLRLATRFFFTILPNLVHRQCQTLANDKNLRNFGIWS